MTPWTVACQPSLSMGFSRQEYWSGLPFSSPGDLPDPEIEPVSLVSPALQADSLPTEPLRRPGDTWGDMYSLVFFWDWPGTGFFSCQVWSKKYTCKVR